MAATDLVFYVKLTVKPQCVEQWKECTIEVLDRMSPEETFVTCYLHQDEADVKTFTLYERWSEPSVEAFLRNQQSPTGRNTRDSSQVCLSVPWRFPR